MTYGPHNWPFRNKFLRAELQEFGHLSHLGHDAMKDAAEYALAERAEAWIEAGFYEHAGAFHHDSGTLYLHLKRRPREQRS